MSVINRGPTQASTQQTGVQQQQQQQHRVVHHQHQHHQHHSYQRRTGPLNVVTGSRISQLQPFHATSIATSNEMDSTAAKTCCSADTAVPSSSPSLPAVLASLSTGVLLGAAAMNVCGPDQTAFLTSALSVVDSLKEFGSTDVITQGFGPSRHVWTALMQQSSHHEAPAASASAIFWLHERAVDVARQLHLPYTDSGGGGGGGAITEGTSAASLMAEALSAAEGAAAVMSGALGGVCDTYNRWLQESPLTCKVVTGNLFTVAGDMLAQLGLGGGNGGHGGEADGACATSSTASDGRRKVDWMRTARLCLETSAFGTPLAHWWFDLLDSRIMPENPHSPAAVLTKMLADQVLFAPLGLLMFFAVIKCLEGRPRDLPQTLQSSYLKTLLGGYLLWPLAGILNFALLPNEYRLLFNNCVNIIWTCFLSIMSSGDDSSSKAAGSSAAAIAAAGTSVVTPGSTSHLGPIATPAAGTASATALMTPTSSTCVASGIASDLAKAAVAAAAISAAAGNRPAFGCVAGLAVAVMGATLETYVPPLQQQQVNVPAQPQPQVVTVKMYKQQVMGAAC